MKLGEKAVLDITQCVSFFSYKELNTNMLPCSDYAYGDR